MSLSTFTNTAVATALEDAEVADLLLTQTMGDVTDRGITLFDEVDAALIEFGEAPRTDLMTTRVTLSAGAKLVLQRLANSDSLTWTDFHPFTRTAQTLVDGLLDPITDLSSGSFTPDTPVTATDPNYSALGTKIISQGNDLTTAAIAKLREAVAAALEKFDPLCKPARVNNAWTFSALCKEILLIMASGTPTVFPVEIFQAKYDALLAAFNASVTEGIARTQDVADV